MTPLERSSLARIAALMRKRHAGGRPRKDGKRCPCEQNTLRRAKERRFDCCRKAGHAITVKGKPI